MDSDKGRHVLLVDDEPDILESLKDHLEREADVEVTTAGSGAEAMRALSSHPPDLVIADYRMPGMDGLALLKGARQAAPGTARIMMTAYASLELAKQAINEARVSGFLRKPLDADRLVVLVQDILKR